MSCIPPTVEAVFLARHRLVEEHYKELEEIDPPAPLTDGQIAEMNRSLGFKPGATNYKGQDYRPYCVRQRCEFMPRMYRVEDGFRCWCCGGHWDLSGCK